MGPCPKAGKPLPAARPDHPVPGAAVAAMDVRRGWPKAHGQGGTSGACFLLTLSLPVPSAGLRWCSSQFSQELVGFSLVWAGPSGVRDQAIQTAKTPLSAHLLLPPTPRPLSGPRDALRHPPPESSYFKVKGGSKFLKFMRNKNGVNSTVPGKRKPLVSADSIH